MKNAQLWKRILNEGIAFGDLPPETLLMLKKMENTIIVSPIIVAGEIKKEVGKQNLSDYKRLSIPFDIFWLECSFQEPGHLMGVAVVTSRKTTPWKILCFLVIARPGERPLYLGWFENDVSETGDIIPKFNQAIDGEATLWHPPENIDMGDFGNTVINIAHGMTFDTLLMLGCNNVSLKANEIDRAQIRRAEKRFGPSSTGYRYHTLIVRPPGAKSDHPGEEIGNMPRHVCRGHFAEYGPDFGKGLLFGKYAGRFYVPPHLKGDKKNGTVEKDYEVKAFAR